MRVPGADGRADKRFALPGRYRSSEIRTGDALMSARPGLCGGRRATGGPYRDHSLTESISHEESMYRWCALLLLLASPSNVGSDWLGHHSIHRTTVDR